MAGRGLISRIRFSRTRMCGAARASRSASDRCGRWSGRSACADDERDELCVRRWSIANWRIDPQPQLLAIVHHGRCDTEFDASGHGGPIHTGIKPFEQSPPAATGGDPVRSLKVFSRHFGNLPIPERVLCGGFCSPPRQNHWQGRYPVENFEHRQSRPNSR